MSSDVEFFKCYICRYLQCLCLWCVYMYVHQLCIVHVWKSTNSQGRQDTCQPVYVLCMYMYYISVYTYIYIYILKKYQQPGTTRYVPACVCVMYVYYIYVYIYTYTHIYIEKVSIARDDKIRPSLCMCYVFMYVYICMCYVLMYVYICVCMYVSMYRHAYICIYIYIYIY